MKLSQYTIVQSEDGFNKVRDADGYVKAFITFDESYFNDINYAFKKLNINSGKPLGNTMPISFPFKSFNRLKQIVGISYLEVQEPVNILPIENSNKSVVVKKQTQEIKNKMEKYLNLKIIAGVGVGVAVGHFVVKTKNPLILIAFGIGGGVLANMIKTDTEKKQEDEEKVRELLQEISQDEDGVSDFSGAEFNPTVGYFTPKGTVEETNPSDYLDVSF